MKSVVIIGNGVTGITAARHLRQLQPDWSITVISGESTHHYSRPALMYIFMGHMRYADTKPHEDSLWSRERIDLVRDWVVGIDPMKQALSLHRGGAMSYDKLLLATGSKSNKFGWPGQDLDGVQGLYDLMDLHLLYQNAKGARSAVIVGGGLIGIELAEMLHSRNIQVTILARERFFWDNVLPVEEAAMVSRCIEREGFDLRLETELAEILPGPDGRVARVRTNHGDEIEAQLVGLTAGVSPNIDLVRESPIETGRGILVDWSLRTNIENICAAGDCAEIVREGAPRNLIQQVWYTGKRQAVIAAETLAGNQAVYEPGIWYNSAKFLDLEYQVYGEVSNVPVEGQSTLYWEHENGLHSLRLVHSPGNGLIGVNVMGLRYRHEVCEGWIGEHRPIDYVLDHLAEANFDTEFDRRHEPEIVATLKEQA